MRQQAERGRAGAEPQTPQPWTDEAIAQLWRRHRRWVAAVVYAHKPRDPDLEDLLQEVAMKLVRHIHTIEDPEAVRPWLRTVAINVARSAGRKSRSRRQYEAPPGAIAMPEPVDVDGSPIAKSREWGPQPLASIRDGAVDRGASARGRLALSIASGLPPHYREPLLLSLRGLSHKEIAQALDVPVTTIETRLIRARRIIHDELLALEGAANNRNNNTAGAGQ